MALSVILSCQLAAINWYWFRNRTLAYNIVPTVDIAAFLVVHLRIIRAAMRVPSSYFGKLPLIVVR